jgi:hypothetical protein
MVLEMAAFGEDGGEDSTDGGGIEGSGVALDKCVEEGCLAGFIGDGQAVFTLEAGDLSDGLGATVEETEKFKIEFIDGVALLLKGLGHGALSFGNDGKNTKAAI